MQVGHYRKVHAVLTTQMHGLCSSEEAEVNNRQAGTSSPLELWTGRWRTGILQDADWMHQRDTVACPSDTCPLCTATNIQHA